jgi:mannitol 2-dehydrogenase
MKLSEATLESIASRAKVKVKVPQYDRSKVQSGILHIGVGNFHRAHMASYMDDLLTANFEAGKEWGIVGAGIMKRFDQPKRDLLEPQDWLQTVVEHDAEAARPRIVGSMTDFLPIDPTAIATALQDPKFKIVSLTVTEGGYFLADGAFDLAHPDIQHDITNPDSPKTVFGLLCQAARFRKERNLPLFTILSCDNIPHNGDVCRSVVTGLAKAQDPAFAAWLDEKMGFPNSMVDRITPATTEEQKAFIQEHYGYEEAAPVFCEPFRQWVLEDTFSESGRPPLDQLENVKFVPDVTPYEFMKIRILNGGHASLCYPSALLDIPYVHESMQHPTIAAFLDCLEHQEIIPTVPPVPDTVLTEYWETIAKRFSNPTLKDTIGRNCYDGASRQPKFIIGAVKDNLQAGRAVDGMAVVSALWCRYCQGTTESGTTIAPNDPQWDRLSALALQAKLSPKLWLEGLPEVYGATATSSVFIQAFDKALTRIQTDGVESAMKQYVADCKNK